MKKNYFLLVFLPLLSSGQNLYPTNGLQVYIPVFNGSVQNLATNGLSVMATGTQFTTNRTGVANQAIQIPSTQAKLAVPYTGQESAIETQELTVAMWFKADSINQTYYNLAEIRNSIFIRFRIDKIIQYGYKNGPGAGDFAVRDLNFPTAKFYDSVFVGKWNHIAMTTSLDTNQSTGSVRRLFRVYLNGQPFDSAQALNNLNINYQGDVSQVCFGCRNSATNMNLLNGSIDEVFYYSRRLSHQEILSLYNTDFTNIGIEEKPLTAAQIYPNPVSGTMHVSYNGVVKSYRIFDVAGRLISEDAVHADRFQVTAESLKAGSYIIELTDADHRVFRQKFIKK